MACIFEYMARHNNEWAVPFRRLQNANIVGNLVREGATTVGPG
jgi:hypothetical protein